MWKHPQDWYEGVLELLGFFMLIDRYSIELLIPIPHAVILGSSKKSKDKER